VGFHFRKSFKVAPGVRLNMGRSGFTSMSFGPRGMKMNVGKRGVRTTVGIPGTGLSYTTSTSSGARTAHKHATTQVPVEVAVAVRPKPANSHKLLKTLGTLVLALIVGAATHWLVGLLAAVVLLVMISRPHPRAAPESAQVLVPTGVAKAPPESRQAATQAPASTVWERLVLTAPAKLCAEPDGRSKRLGVLGAQTEVTVLGRRPGWMFVQDDSGVEGWARDEHWIPGPR
jgi:hypothetical protein